MREFIYILYSKYSIWAPILREDMRCFLPRVEGLLKQIGCIRIYCMRVRVFPEGGAFLGGGWGGSDVGLNRETLMMISCFRVPNVV